jgi:ribosomal protein S12 methylthiotransferase accessory factor
VDPKVGVIGSVEIVNLSDLDPRVYLAYAPGCDTFALTEISASNNGAACSVDLDRAIARACGESVERYCSAFFDLDSMLYASRREIERDGRRCFDAAAFYPFASWQYDLPGFPFEQASPDQAVHWVTATSLTTSSPVYVPASCVFVPYRFESEREPFTHMPISTGLAAGPSVESCVEKGIFEIIERDALMLVWAARIPAPRIDSSTCWGMSDQVDRLLQSTAALDATWFLNYMTLDVDVPVISAVLIDDGVPPLTSFGIAANLDPAQALQSALEEAILTRLLVNRSSEVWDEAEPSPTELRTLRAHLIAHATSEELRSRMGFLTHAGPVVSFDEARQLGDSLAPLTSRLDRCGLEVLWADVTTPDVAEVGFRVVRTLIPGMQPLDNDHEYRYLGGRRLSAVPGALGHDVGDPASLNPDPHPFP